MKMQSPWLFHKHRPKWMKMQSPWLFHKHWPKWMKWKCNHLGLFHKHFTQMDENAITLVVVVVVLVCLLALVDTKYITWKHSHLSSCRPEDFSKIWPEMCFVIMLGISCLFHVKISTLLFM
jgi:hypothetical protein